MVNFHPVNLLFIGRLRLETWPTKKLVKELNYLRPIVIKSYRSGVEPVYEESLFYRIKAILKDRPHVPNKKEAKKIRQARVKLNR